MSGKTKLPSDAVTISRVKPVCALVTVTLAVPTTAPAGSSTVPAIVPVGSAAQSVASSRKHPTINRLMFKTPSIRLKTGGSSRDESQHYRNVSDNQEYFLVKSRQYVRSDAFLAIANKLPTREKGSDGKPNEISARHTYKYSERILSVCVFLR